MKKEKCMVNGCHNPVPSKLSKYGLCEKHMRIRKHCMANHPSAGRFLHGNKNKSAVAK